MIYNKRRAKNIKLDLWLMDAKFKLKFMADRRFNSSLFAVNAPGVIMPITPS